MSLTSTSLRLKVLPVFLFTVMLKVMVVILCMICLACFSQKSRSFKHFLITGRTSLKEKDDFLWSMAQWWFSTGNGKITDDFRLVAATTTFFFVFLCKRIRSYICSVLGMENPFMSGSIFEGEVYSAKDASDRNMVYE